MSTHTSPFGKHSAEVIANKSNKIFTFTKEDKGETRDQSRDQCVEQSWSGRTARNEGCNILRPQSRTSSFYNGYCSPCSPEVPKRSHSPQLGVLKRSDSPYRDPHIRTNSPLSSASCPSPDSPRRRSQEDCTEENCLNLFHQHNINKSPRSTYSDWGKSSSRSLSRTPTPTKSLTSRDTVMTSRDSGVVSRTPSPSKEPGLDRLSQAIRNMDNLYNVGLDGDFAETLTGLGESVNVTELDKANMLLAHNIAPLFPELTEETVTIERVLEVWEEKGLKDSTDRSIIEFLKRVDSMSRGENQIIPQILCYNVEAILTSNEVQSDTLRESAIATFKSVITTLQSNLAQVQYDMDALSVALERRSEELEKAMQEYEERLDLEHRKSDEKLRLQKEAMRQSSLQLEKEGEQKIEKLNNQMDGIIRRTDKEIKNLKNEEANLKKIISDRDEDIRLTKKYLHEAQNELIKYDELQDAYKIVVEEYQKLHRLMEEKQRQHCEEQENIDELKRYREETAEENKRLKDQLDELHAKFSACKMKLEKEEKNAKNAAKRLKKAQQKLQEQCGGDSLAVDQRQRLRQRLSVAVPMFTKEADPSLAPTIDTDLDTSINDEILDSESNNVLELQEEVWRLQEEIDNQNFEMERYGRILMKQQEELEMFREKEEREKEEGEKEERVETGISPVPRFEVDNIGDQENMVPETEVTVAQEKVLKLEKELKENVDLVGLTKEEVRSKQEEVELLTEESRKREEEMKILVEEKKELKEKNTLLETRYNETVRRLEKGEEREEEEKSMVEKLQSQLTELQEQVSLLNGTLELNATEIESLESQLEENGLVISSYQEIIEEKDNLLDQCKAEFSTCKEEFARATEQIAQLTQHVQKIEHERTLDLEQNKHKVSELESAIDKMEEEKTASSARATELAALQDKSIVSGDLIKRLQNTVDELSIELGNTKTALDEAESECTELKQQVSDMECVDKVLSEKEEENRKLNNELVEINEMLNEQLQKLGLVELERSELAVKMAQIEEEKSESETRVKQLEEEKSESETRVKQLEDEKSESETRVKQLEEKIAQDAKETETEKRALADELALTRNLLAEKVEELANTSSRLSTSFQEMEDQRAFRDKEKGELEHILESKEEEIETLKSHLDQVENDYEALVDSLNKETDSRVSELQNQLEETAGDISSLKSQLKDLGQQLVVLSGERERFYNENCKLKVDNERLCGEKELLIAKVEEVKAVRDTLELDIEQQVAEYQDMMKCCANLQQENMDYIKDLEDSAFQLNEKTAQLEQAEKEKEDIIQLFEDKIREKEEDLERSILEKSELEGRARETEVELSKTRSSNNTLDDVKRNLEQQLAAVIKSLDDLTERYEIENSILEEKVVESINEVKEVQNQAEETLHEQLEEQKEKMYEEFRKEMETIKEKHETEISEIKEHTSSTIAEFKKKCEKKMKDMKERYKEDIETKETVISDMKTEIVKKNESHEKENEKLKEMFAQEKAQLIDSLSSDKDKLLEKLNLISEDKIKQLEETHRKGTEVFEEKLRNLQETCERLEREGREAKDSLVESNEKWSLEKEAMKEATSKLESAHQVEISELHLLGVKREDEIVRLQDKLADLKERLEQKEEENREKVLEIESLTKEHGERMANLVTKHKEEMSEQNNLHEIEKKNLEKKHGDLVQDIERKSLSERKSLVSEYNDLINSMKTEQEEEVEILKNQQEDLRKNLEQRNEDLVAALDESRELVREKDLEIDDLNEEIFKVQEENVKTLQEHENELSAIETEREELISSFKEKEKNLLEEVEKVRESSFLEMENNVSEMSALRGKLENLSQEYDQLQSATVDRAQHDKLRGKVAVLSATLRAEQAVSRERALQVTELMEVKTGLEEQLSVLKEALQSEKLHLNNQLNLLHNQEQESREELVSYYKSVQAELERRLDHVVHEHSLCYNTKRKIQSLKQQLAVEKTAHNPNTELAHKLQTSTVYIESLEKQVSNLETANVKLESSVMKLMEENAELVDRVNNTEHQIHLALQETIKTKSQKVAICKVLENVVNCVTTAA